MGKFFFNGVGENQLFETFLRSREASKCPGLADPAWPTGATSSRECAERLFETFPRSRVPSQGPGLADRAWPTRVKSCREFAKRLFKTFARSRVVFQWSSTVRLTCRAKKFFTGLVKTNFLKRKNLARQSANFVPGPGLAYSVGKLPGVCKTAF